MIFPHDEIPNRNQVCPSRGRIQGEVWIAHKVQYLETFLWDGLEKLHFGIELHNDNISRNLTVSSYAIYVSYRGHSWGSNLFCNIHSFSSCQFWSRRSHATSSSGVVVFVNRIFIILTSSLTSGSSDCRFEEPNFLVN